MTVSNLKQVLQKVIDELDCYEDDLGIKLVSNTYHLRGSNLYLGTSQGYLDLNNISDRIEESNDEFDEDC